MMAVWCGVTALAGHMWPVYLSFKGGKGVATGAGVIFAMNWIAGCVALGVFLVAFLALRIVSVGSMVGAIGMAVTQVLTATHSRYADKALPITVFCVMLAVLVIVKHRENLKRLMKGEEKKFSFSKKDAG